MSHGDASGDLAGSAGLRPRRGSQHVPACSWRSEAQRRGFGPGEDHNIEVMVPRPCSASSAGTSAPARITTPRVRADPDDAPAAPGLRPRRGSQRHRRQRRPSSAEAAAPGLRPRRGSQHRDQVPHSSSRAAAPGPRPRRGSQPAGADRGDVGNPAAPELRPRRGSQPRVVVPTSASVWQRRELRPRRGSQQLTRRDGPAGAAAPELRPRRGSQHRVRSVVQRCTRQRRDFGPGEDHNSHLVTGQGLPRSSSAGASAPARITTARGSTTWATTTVAPGLRPGGDHNRWMVAEYTEGCPTAPASPREDHKAAPGASAPARITTRLRPRRPRTTPR